MQRAGAFRALGLSGQTGLSGASERSESESGDGAWHGKFEEMREVGNCSGSIGLSGASERSSLESECGELDRGHEATEYAVACWWVCVLVGIAKGCELEV